MPLLVSWLPRRLHCEIRAFLALVPCCRDTSIEQGNGFLSVLGIYHLRKKIAAADVRGTRHVGVAEKVTAYLVTAYVVFLTGEVHAARPYSVATPSSAFSPSKAVLTLDCCSRNTVLYPVGDLRETFMSTYV